MNKIDLTELKKFVNDNIIEFHKSKIAALQRLNLNTVLKKKNPYLLKLKTY